MQVLSILQNNVPQVACLMKDRLVRNGIVNQLALPTSPVVVMHYYQQAKPNDSSTYKVQMK